VKVVVIIMILVSLEDITVAAVITLVRGDVAAILAEISGVVAMIIVLEDEGVVMNAIMNVLKKTK